MTNEDNKKPNNYIIHISMNNLIKIKEIQLYYKSLGFNYDFDKIINDLISGNRPLIKCKDEIHKNEILTFNFYESHELKVIADFKCLGYYMIYKQNDLIFKPCKLYDKYIIKHEWEVED